MVLGISGIITCKNGFLIFKDGTNKKEHLKIFLPDDIDFGYVPLTCKRDGKITEFSEIYYLYKQNQMQELHKINTEYFVFNKKGKNTEISFGQGKNKTFSGALSFFYIFVGNKIYSEILESVLCKTHKNYIGYFELNVDEMEKLIVDSLHQIINSLDNLPYKNPCTLEIETIKYKFG